MFCKKSPGGNAAGAVPADGVARDPAAELVSVEVAVDAVAGCPLAPPTMHVHSSLSSSLCIV